MKFGFQFIAQITSLNSLLSNYILVALLDSIVCKCTNKNIKNV